MIVTARAADRKAHEHRAGGRCPVRHGFVPILFEIDPAFEVTGSVPMEAGCDQLVRGRIRQQVTGDLFNRELGERHVAVQRIDHPVAVFPNGTRGIDAVTVRVGVASGIQPVPSPALAVMRRRK